MKVMHLLYRIGEHLRHALLAIGQTGLAACCVPNSQNLNAAKRFIDPIKDPL
jgi:hypothetical protein